MSGTKFPEINNNSSNLGASSGSQGDSMDVSRQLSILKHRKKTAANDAQLLLNRIALLQKEEERARRKIEKTKDRASEILTMRDENFQRVDRFVRAAEEEHVSRTEYTSFLYSMGVFSQFSFLSFVVYSTCKPRCTRRT